MKPPYMSESWFELLQQRTEGQKRTQVAKTLGISPATLSQVLNGSGEYGKGTASTSVSPTRWFTPSAATCVRT